MNSSPQWKIDSLAIVEDFEKHLPRSAPKQANLTLGRFRQRIARARNRKEVALVEAELELLLNSRPYYRGAARRSIRARFQVIISKLERLLGLVTEYNRVRSQNVRH
jgi:hypothetical protein